MRWGLTLCVVSVLAVTRAFAAEPAPAATTATQCCTLEACFVSTEAARAYENANDCRLCDPCTRVVGQLRALPMPPDDPTNGFLRNQTCIASAACSQKASLENPRWLDPVVRDFVDPFVTQAGDWKKVIEGCRQRPNYLPLRDELCQNDMASYHISQDLQKSLNQNGCGTQNDWDAIGRIITQCIDEGMSGFVPGVRQLARLYAARVVSNRRDSVRNQCIEHRRRGNLPIEG